MIETHAALLTAVHVAVDEAAVTDMLPVDAPAATLAEVAPKAKATAAWLTVSVTGVVCPVPEMVIAADLVDVAAFPATWYATVPLPFPVAPLDNVIQLAEGVADHEQPAGAVT